MPSGIRATVEFTTPVCPITEFSASADTIVDSVSTNVCPTDATVCGTEFSVDTDEEPDGNVTRVFSHGSTNRYRIIHDEGVNCPCACIGQFGCSTARYSARNGALTLVFYAADYEQLQTVVGALREQFPEVDIKRLVRSPTEEGDGDSIFVDRGQLTGRQLEVVETAYEMGYFERPRDANATEVADELGIDQSTFSEHLIAAESKLIGDVLEDGM